MEEEILQFHARTQYAYPRNVPSTFFNFIPGVSILESERLETFLQPVYEDAIDVAPQEQMPIFRTHSADSFREPESISENALFSILQNTFLCFEIPNDPNAHRPYSSAGALYPVEAIVAILSPLKERRIQQGFYHVLPESKMLGRINAPADRPFDPNLYSDEAFGDASFSIIYFLNLPKATFKYQYRGYRHGLMEVGSLYQQADLAARHARLSSRSWSGFSDDLISSSIGLNKRELLPILIQCFGKENVSHDAA